MQVEVRGSMHVGHQLRVVVELPLVESFADVDLELTAGVLQLISGAHAPLTLTLPHQVDPDSAAAKFIKKKRVLRVDVKVLPGQL
jgi:HSP20 family molecular chaperone IbpA